MSEIDAQCDSCGVVSVEYDRKQGPADLKCPICGDSATCLHPRHKRRDKHTGLQAAKHPQEYFCGLCGADL